MRRNSKHGTRRNDLAPPRQIRFHKDAVREMDAMAEENRISFADLARIAAHVGLRELKAGRATLLEVTN